jgi:uncharacterized protein (TIGR03437 family)
MAFVVVWGGRRTVLSRPGILFLLAVLTPAAAQQYTISTIAGGSPPSSPVPALNASISTPSAIAVDSAGNVYFTSTNCVFKLSQSGTLTRIAGTSGFGYAGDGGPATQALLNLGDDSGAFPAGVAVDGGGNVYFVDINNYCVRKISTSGVITTIAGNGKSGAGSVFRNPLGVAVDSSGNLYVADYGGGEVFKITPSGTISGFAGNGYSGTFGIGGPAASASLDYPTAVAADSAGNVYITDGVGRVLKVATNGIISLVATLLDGSVIQYISGIAADSSGNLYVTSWTGNSLLKVTAGGVVTTVAGNGAAGYSGDNGPASSAQLSRPAGVGVDASGNIYIADLGNNRIRRISPAGMINTIAGNGIQSGDNGPALAAQLALPSAVALDPFGNLFIADSGDLRVRKVSPAGTITTVAGNGVSPVPGAATGDGSPAVAVSLGAEGVALDAAGNFYLSDGASVRKVSASGIITTLTGGIYSGYSGDGGPASSATLYDPAGLAVDAAGNVYIADVGNNRIRKVSPAGMITTVAGNGTRGYSGDGGPATAAELNWPYAVAVDALGNLYIADSYNNRIREVSTNGIITTVAGDGNYEYGPIPGNIEATAVQVNQPSGVAVSATGDLFISDTGNNRVLKVPSGSGFIFDVSGSPAPGYAGDGGLATNAALNQPWGLAVDPFGSVYIADSHNSVIRVLKPVPLAITSGTVLPSGAVGAAYSFQLGVSAGTPPYKWSITGGALPAGLSLSSGGVIGGTPATSETATFTIEVIDSTAAVAVQSFSLTVKPGPLVIPPSYPPYGLMGIPYSFTFTASGGAAPYAWSLASGALPSGLTFSAAGSISGMPTAEGVYGLTVKVSDTAGDSATLATGITINYPSGYVGPPTISLVLSAGASQNAIRPGSWAAIYGSDLSATNREWTSQDLNGDNFPTSLSGVTVSIGGKAAFIRSISLPQIDFQVPDGLAPGPAAVTVTNAAGTSAAGTATISNYAPAFFVGAVANSRSYVAATEAASGGTVYIGPVGVSGVRPAMAGENLTLWGTGFGPTLPEVAAGTIFNGSAPMSDPVQIFIDGIAVSPQFAGVTSAGLYQFNMVVPNLTPGDHQVTASVAGISTAGGVWLATQ